MKEGADHAALTRLLARYEFATLLPEEKRAFEAHVLECDLCFQALERGSVAVGAMREHACDFVEAVREGRTRARSPRSSIADRLRLLVEPVLRPRVLVPVAALLVFAVVGVRVALGPPGYTRLATFPLEETASSIVRGPGVGDAVRELMETGAAYFDLGRYDEAARRFRATLERAPDLPEAAYLLGLSLARSGQFDEAVPALEKAARHAGGDFHAKALWVLANAYLKTERLEPARSTLEGLARDGGAYASDARDLLDRLPH